MDTWRAGRGGSVWVTGRRRESVNIQWKHNMWRSVVILCCAATVSVWEEHCTRWTPEPLLKDEALPPDHQQRAVKAEHDHCISDSGLHVCFLRWVAPLVCSTDLQTCRFSAIIAVFLVNRVIPVNRVEPEFFGGAGCYGWTWACTRDYQWTANMCAPKGSLEFAKINFSKISTTHFQDIWMMLMWGG